MGKASLWPRKSTLLISRKSAGLRKQIVSLSIVSSWQLWPVCQHCQTIIMATLAYVSALSIQSSWQVWPVCQHCQTIIMATLAFVSALPISEVNSTLFMVKFNNLCLLNVSSIYCRFLFSFSHSNVYLYLIYYLHE